MALANYPGYEELLASGTHLKCQVPNCKWLHEFKSLEKLEGHLKRAHNVSKADLQYHWVHLDARAKHERCAAGLQRCVVISPACWQGLAQIVNNTERTQHKHKPAAMVRLSPAGSTALGDSTHAHHRRRVDQCGCGVRRKAFQVLSVRQGSGEW